MAKISYYLIILARKEDFANFFTVTNKKYLQILNIINNICGYSPCEEG